MPKSDLLNTILDLEIRRTPSGPLVDCRHADGHATPVELVKAAILLEGVANTLRRVAETRFLDVERRAFLLSGS